MHTTNARSGKTRRYERSPQKTGRNFLQRTLQTVSDFVQEVQDGIRVRKHNRHRGQHSSAKKNYFSYKKNSKVTNKQRFAGQGHVLFEKMKQAV